MTLSCNIDFCKAFWNLTETDLLHVSTGTVSTSTVVKQETIDYMIMYQNIHGPGNGQNIFQLHKVLNTAIIAVIVL